MSVKANWHTDELIAAQDDPFGGPRVEEVGKPVDLSGPAKLNERLAGLVNEETRLFHAGVTCDIKDAEQATCGSCPLRETDPLEHLSALCAVGVQQERIVTLLSIHRLRPDALPGD